MGTTLIVAWTYAAVLFAVLFVLISRHGAALEFLIAAPTGARKASELAEHLMLVDLRPKGVTGVATERALGRANITCNKNGVPFDPEKLCERYENGDPIEELVRQGSA